jgi:hypothetical protein
VKGQPPKKRRHVGRGGRGGHEPKARIAMREMRAHDLSVQGWSQYAIATDLGVSQPAVSKILRRVELRALNELSALVERHKVRQTLRLQHIYAEGMRAWERSKTETTRRRQRKTQPGTSGVGTTSAEILIEPSHGDPRYLEESRKALGDLNKLWGLDAPQRIDVRAPKAPYADLSEEQLRALVAEQRILIELSGQDAPAAVDPPTDRNRVTR